MPLWAVVCWLLVLDGASSYAGESASSRNCCLSCIIWILFWWLLIFHKSCLGFSSSSCKTERKCPQPCGLGSEVECWKVSHVLLAKACYKGRWDLRARKQIPTLHKSSCAYLKITIFATSSLSCLSYSLTFTLRWLTYLLGTYYRYLWRRQWHPTPVLLPRKSHGRRSLLGCSPWDHEESDVTERLHFHFHFPALEKEMATHSSVLAWRIPGTGEPGWLPFMGSHRVRHDWSNLAATQIPLSRCNEKDLNTNESFWD